MPLRNQFDTDAEWLEHLRIYFAAKAMQSLIVDPDRVDQSRAECARLAYAMADAMLTERAKGAE